MAKMFYTMDETQASLGKNAEEIKQLFVADERPEFVPFFDRAYAAGVQAGGGSWVGRDPDGHIVMHLACFPRRFRFGERDVVGGLMRDALVARPYRSFFPAHAMIKRATEDTSCARRRTKEAQEDLEQGRFAGPIGSQ